MGVVEKSALGAPFLFFISSRPVLLVCNAISIWRDGGSMGPPFFDVCTFLFYLSDSYVVLFRGKYVYSQNNDVCGVGFYNSTHSTFMEIGVGGRTLVLRFICLLGASLNMGLFFML